MAKYTTKVVDIEWYSTRCAVLRMFKVVSIVLGTLLLQSTSYFL